MGFVLHVGTDQGLTRLLIKQINDEVDLSGLERQFGEGVVKAAVRAAVKSWLAAEVDAIRGAAQAVLEQEGAPLSQESRPAEAVVAAMGPAAAGGANTPAWLRQALLSLPAAPVRMVGS